MTIIERLNHIVAAIYKTYVSLKRDMPHFRAMLTIVFLLFLHTAQFVLIFNLPPNYLLPASSTDKTIRWIEGMIFFGTLTGLCSLIFPKKKLDKQLISDHTISKTKKILPWYFAGTILLVIILAALHGIKKGTIHL